MTRSGRGVGRHARWRSGAAIGALALGAGCRALLDLDGYSFDRASEAFEPDGGPGAGDAGCRGASCAPCTPDERRCSDGVPERCDDDGTRWIALEACSTSAPVCFAGACVVCAPDAVG